PVGQSDELTSREVVSMSVAGPAEDGHVRYVGEFETRHAGRYGFTVRVVPRHPDLASSAEMGLAAWADRQPPASPPGGAHAPGRPGAGGGGGAGRVAAAGRAAATRPPAAAPGRGAGRCRWPRPGGR